MHRGKNRSRKPVEVLKTTPSPNTNASTQQPISSITKINTLSPLASSESHQHHPPHNAFFQADQILYRTAIKDDQAFDPQPHAAESTSLKLLGFFLQCAECIAMDKLDFSNDFLSEMAKCTFTYVHNTMLHRRLLQPSSNVDNHEPNTQKGWVTEYKPTGTKYSFPSSYSYHWNRIRSKNIWWIQIQEACIWIPFLPKKWKTWIRIRCLLEPDTSTCLMFQASSSSSCLPPHRQASSSLSSS